MKTLPMDLNESLAPRATHLPCRSRGLGVPAARDVRGEGRKAN
ncbi:hypothetical protein EV670_0886 [Rivibacter subsaxonicus]|uniref:Uncharacterized protein n=1 Tax=Rivibacter subsaxonicus TaxID=457575 RepID=A0A4V2FUQ4_9BURK|nr:hypothetical protein EV670_0886 [Rivibacter subsaxonicus]